MSSIKVQRQLSSCLVTWDTLYYKENLTFTYGFNFYRNDHLWPIVLKAMPL